MPACTCHSLRKEFLIGFQMAWLRADTNSILTVGDHVITQNPRVKVSVDLETTYILEIENVRMEDHGEYRCQTNTEPNMQQTAYLEVLSPPTIKRSSHDIKVKTGAYATLECHAGGNPVPTITWLRDDGQQIKAINATTGQIQMCKIKIRAPSLSRLNFC